MVFLLSVVVLAVVVVMFMTVQRVYRSPARPKWLDDEPVVMPVSVTFTGVFAGSIGAIVATSLDLPLGVWGDIGVSLAAIVMIVLIARTGFLLVAGRGPAVPG
ncbi:hypothetical protein [Microbaculum sp. FT89]|uniref:hypothetical protein n=1 Tax=Microbaculum sp. FT89 TaxID=3447298 RepID=UPI003F538624